MHDPNPSVHVVGDDNRQNKQRYAKQYTVEPDLEMPGVNKGENKCGITRRNRRSTSRSRQVGKKGIIKECTRVLENKSKTAEPLEIIAHWPLAMQQQPTGL